MRLSIFIVIFMLNFACKNEPESIQVSAFDSEEYNEVESAFPQIINYFEKKGFEFVIDTTYDYTLNEICYSVIKMDAVAVDTFLFSSEYTIMASGKKMSTINFENDIFSYPVNLIIKEVNLKNSKISGVSFIGYCEMYSNDVFCFLPQNQNRLYYFQFSRIWGEEFEIYYRKEIETFLNEHIDLTQ